MKRILCSLALGIAVVLPALAADKEPGFKPLFNGKNLKGWGGKPELWSAKDGVITGQTTAEHPIKGNTFLVYTNAPVSDFELHFSYKIVSNNEKGFANSGVQYRSKILDPENWVVGGYQADFEAEKTYSGILYEERGRGILAARGEKVLIKDDPNDPKKMVREVVGHVGSSEEIQAAIKPNDWNDYVVIAKGNHLTHIINGKTTIDVTDESTVGAKSGILALQLHAGPPMTVQFKNIRIKQLK